MDVAASPTRDVQVMSSFTGSFDWTSAERIHDVVLLAQRNQLPLVDLAKLGRVGARLPHSGEGFVDVAEKMRGSPTLECGDWHKW